MMSVKEICTDCKGEIFPDMEEYKMRRNSKLHRWEPICMECFRKMVLAKGGKYGTSQEEWEMDRMLFVQIPEHALAILRNIVDDVVNEVSPVLTEDDKKEMKVFIERAGG